MRSIRRWLTTFRTEVVVMGPPVRPITLTLALSHRGRGDMLVVGAVREPPLHKRREEKWLIWWLRLGF